MSWSVSADGTRDEAQRKLDADPQVPPAVRTAVDQLLREFSVEKTVTVTTHGHHDTAGGGNATVSVQTTS